MNALKDYNPTSQAKLPVQFLAALTPFLWKAGQASQFTFTRDTGRERVPTDLRTLALPTNTGEKKKNATWESLAAQIPNPDGDLAAFRR